MNELKKTEMIVGFICTLGVAIFIVLGVYVSALFYVLAFLLLIITIGVFIDASGEGIEEGLPRSPTIETWDDYRKKQGYTSCRDYWVKQGVLKDDWNSNDW